MKTIARMLWSLVLPIGAIAAGTFFLGYSLGTTTDRVVEAIVSTGPGPSSEVTDQEEANFNAMCEVDPNCNLSR